jgi:hypothetical protein
MSADEHARLRREEAIEPSRRRELAKVVNEATRGLGELELRYVRDLVTARLGKVRG